MQLQVTQVMTSAPLSVDSIRPVAYARCMPVHRGPADAWDCRMRVGDDMADACTRAISRFLVPGLLAVIRSYSPLSANPITPAMPPRLGLNDTRAVDINACV